MRNLIAKFELCNFNIEIAFQVTDGRTNGHQRIIRLWSYIFNSAHNLKAIQKSLFSSNVIL